MKITLAFYGIPRDTAIAAPSIEKNLLGPLRGLGTVTVIYHLWRIDQISSKRSGEHAALPDDAYDYFKGFAGVIEPAEAFELTPEFNSWKLNGDPFDDDFGSLRNLMHQLQSLKRVTRLVQATHPNLVVFARPDLQYHDPIPLSACRFMARMPRCCAVPIWNWWGGLNDRFAICGKEAYKAYGDRIEQATAFAHYTGRPIHSESLLRFALRKGHVLTLAIPLRASRVRLNGVVREENFHSVETSFLRRRWRDRLDRLRCRATGLVSQLIFRDARWNPSERVDDTP